MYLLTIVFLVSHVTIVSLHASRDACELAAQRALLMSAGPQAVESARCAPQEPAVSAIRGMSIPGSRTGGSTSTWPVP